MAPPVWLEQTTHGLTDRFVKKQNLLKYKEKLVFKNDFVTQFSELQTKIGPQITKNMTHKLEKLYWYMNKNSFDKEEKYIF